MITNAACRRAVTLIEGDLADRNGLEWDMIDNETKQEIRNRWAELIKRAVDEESKRL